VCFCNLNLVLSSLAASCPPWDEQPLPLVPTSLMLYLTVGPESMETKTKTMNWNFQSPEPK
jgi:hypothetical protein